MSSSLNGFLSISIGISYNIVESTDCLYYDLIVGSKYQIVRSEKHIKQYTLFKLSNNMFNNDKDIYLAQKELEKHRTLKMKSPILPIISTTIITEENSEYLLILCDKCHTFNEYIHNNPLNNITCDEVKYNIYDLYQILISLPNVINDFLFTRHSIVYVRDSVSSKSTKRTMDIVSPFSKLMISPIALLTQFMSIQSQNENSNIVNSKNNITSQFNSFGTFLTEHIKLVNVKTEQDLFFINKTKTFAKDLCETTASSIQDIDRTFFEDCTQFCSLPQGDLNSYKPIRFVSKGGCGIVMIVEKEGKYYAMKQSSIKDISQREARCMKLFNHPNIVQLIDYIESPKSFVEKFGIRVNRAKMFYYIIMEYCEAESIDKHVNKPLELDVIKNIMNQVNNGIKYLLKEKHMIHCDIKLSNILLQTNTKFDENQNYKVKISDFGFCRSVGIDDEHSSLGTPLYSGPEIFINSSPTYKRKSLKRALRCNSKVTFPNFIQNNIYSNYKSLISKLICSESERLSWNDYFNDEFFKAM
ncbi:Protein kinase domain containing protein [Entamoeba marina]